MPTVPEYGDQKVKVAPMSGAKQNINTTVDDFGGQQARGMAQAGRQIGQSADLMADYASKRAKEDNETAVWDTYIKLSDQERDYLYNAETGAMTKTGADAGGLTGKSAKEIGGMAEKLAGTLQNDEQKAMFKELYQKKLVGTLDGLARHEATERRTYKDQVATGVIKTAQQDAASRWNDPAYIDTSADLAATAMAGNMRSKGMAEELITAETNSLRSGVWKSAVEKAIQADPQQAKKLLDENRKKLTGEDAAALDKAIEAPLRVAKASAIAGQVLGGGGALPSTVSTKIAATAAAQGVDVTTALTIAKIENGKGDPALKNPESSATGIYQFVDDTWKAEGGTKEDRLDLDKQIEKGIGLIKKNTEGLRSALGRDPSPAEIYLAHQQGLAGAKALINAPAGMTATMALAPFYKDGASGAQAAIVKNGGTADMSAAAFVSKWGAKYAQKSGPGYQATLSEKITAAKALAGDDPELQKTAIAEVTSQHNTMEAAKKDEEDAALERIYGHVLQTGTYAGANAADLAKLDNKTLLELQTKARDVKTNWEFYDKFMSLPPAEKAKVPLIDLMTNLSETDRRAAIKERTSGKAGDSKAPWLQERGTVMTSYAREAGILPDEGKKATDAQLGKYNGFSAYMNRKADEYRAKNGQEMPEAEFRKEAARAVTKVQVPSKGWFGGKSTEEARFFETNGRSIQTIKDVADLPQAMRSQIESSIRAQGKTVSDALVLGLAKAWVTEDYETAKTILSGAK